MLFRFEKLVGKSLKDGEVDGGNSVKSIGLTKFAMSFEISNALKPGYLRGPFLRVVLDLHSEPGVIMVLNQRLF